MNSPNIKNVENFIRHMLSAISNSSLYSIDHPQTQRMIDLALSNMRTSISGNSLSLLIVDDDIVVEGVRLGRGMFISRFASIVSDRGIASIYILPGIKREEIISFLKDIVDRKKGEIKSTENIRLGRVEVRVETDFGDSSAEGEKTSDLSKIQSLDRDLLLELHEDAKQREGI